MVRHLSAPSDVERPHIHEDTWHKAEHHHVMRAAQVEGLGCTSVRALADNEKYPCVMYQEQNKVCYSNNLTARIC